MESNSVSSIFPTNDPSFKAGLGSLNHGSVEMFRELCRRKVDRLAIGDVDSVLAVILDRVLFYRLQPSDMEKELASLGVDRPLSRQLAKVWEQFGRQILANINPTGNRDLSIGYEILQTVGQSRDSRDDPSKYGDSDPERIRLHFAVGREARTGVTLAPPQLLHLFNTLEQIQIKIDSLYC